MATHGACIAWRGGSRSTSRLAAISNSGDVVVLDLILAPFASGNDAHGASGFAERVQRAADALRRQSADAPHGEPLAVESDALRLEVDPAALASTNLLVGGQ